jgi:hypothetical protein
MLAEGMTSRERLLAALRGDPFDRVPWSPCVDGYFLSSLPSDQQLDEAGLHREVGADAMLRHVMLHTWTAPGLGVRTRARKNPRLDVRIESTSGGRLRVSYETQVGTLVEELTLNHESPHIPWFTKRKLETIEDVKIYLYALETATVDPNPEFFRSTVERLGDDGLVTTSGPASPMEMMHELHRKANEMIAESEAEVVISYENLSTTLTSPRNYERFDRRHCDDYARICRDAGKIYLTHMCGRLTGFAQQLSEADQDGFIDVAPPPTGDVKFGEAKAGWARDKVLAGGIDATAFTGLTPEEMRRYVRDLLCEIESEAGGFHKFILGSGDALPKNTPVPVIRAVSEAVREHFGTGTATQ